jgi:hypothetical protein
MFVLTNRHSVVHDKCGKMSRPHFWASSVAREPSNTSSSYTSSHAGWRRSPTPAPGLRSILACWKLSAAMAFTVALVQCLERPAGCAAVTTAALKRCDCGEMGRYTERSATIKSQCKGFTRSALFWHRLRWSIDEHEQRAHRVLLGYPRNHVMINERRVPTLLGTLVLSGQDTASMCMWSYQAIDQEVFHRSMESFV